MVCSGFFTVVPWRFSHYRSVCSVNVHRLGEIKLLSLNDSILLECCIVCLWTWFKLSFNLFLYSTDDEQDEDVKNKVWNNLRSFAFELGQIFEKCSSQCEFRETFSISFLFNCITIIFLHFIRWGGFSWTTCAQCGKSLQIFV